MIPGVGASTGGGPRAAQGPLSTVGHPTTHFPSAKYCRATVTGSIAAACATTCGASDSLTALPQTAQNRAPCLSPAPHALQKLFISHASLVLLPSSVTARLSRDFWPPLRVRSSRALKVALSNSSLGPSRLRAATPGVA